MCSFVTNTSMKSQQLVPNISSSPKSKGYERLFIFQVKLFIVILRYQ